MRGDERLAVWRAVFGAAERQAAVEVVLEDMRAMTRTSQAALQDGQGRLDPLRLAWAEGARALVAGVEARIAAALTSERPVEVTIARTRDDEA